jgi:hypothetical protein
MDQGHPLFPEIYPEMAVSATCRVEHLLSMLARSSAIAEAGSEFLRMHVDTLRKRGVQWAAIGKALGVSRQAAWERFS